MPPVHIYRLHRINSDNQSTVDYDQIKIENADFDSPVPHSASRQHI